MTPHPWLSVSRTNKTNLSIRLHKLSFSDSHVLGNDAYPSLVSLVGSRQKSKYLACLLGYTEAFPQHGQVRMVHGTCPGHKQSTVFLDCEISSTTSCGFDPHHGKCSSQVFEWVHENLDNFSDHVIYRILAPISSVICFFAADLRGIEGVVRSLAYQARLPKSHNLPFNALPQVLIVVETRSKCYDVDKAGRHIQAKIVQEMVSLKQYTTTEDATRDLSERFRSIRVMDVQRCSSQASRTERINKSLELMQEEVHWARRNSRYLFSTLHLDALSKRLVANVCRQKPYFDFLVESRPSQFDYRQLKSHIDECLALLPGQNWLWRVIVPLLASACCLASYPPGSHLFPSDALFDSFFAGPCRQAIADHTQVLDTQTRFVSSIRSSMEEYFRKLDFDSALQSALTQHVQCLETLWPHLAELKSFRSCFSCFLSTPDKTFECGHAICNTCVRRFSQRCNGDRHSFKMYHCILCGFHQSKERAVFSLLPPTAGLRVLCLDGGGIRGVIPLVFIQHLQNDLSTLDCNIWDMFDYVGGTSAGGLIAIGIFLMHWSPSECLHRFEDLAATVFRSEHEGGQLSWSQTLHRLLRVCVQDHRYSLSPVERAFVSAIGPTEKMFNPLQNDTKVAVMSTSVKANTPCVISNYNGGPRPEDSNYSHIRAAKRCNDITIGDAAACTSAAPFFFKSKDVENVDTFQDGGLRHNCPAFLASWECGAVWPKKGQIFDPSNCQIDHMVSLGTGTSVLSRYATGPHSPRKERFLQRFVGNYKVQLDGEMQWRTFNRCVPPHMSSRLHRLNVSLPGVEPALDDVTAMERLKASALQYIQSNAQTILVRNTMIASIFYLEIDSIACVEGGSQQCHGTIFSRLPLGPTGHRDLYKSLVAKRAFFVINGHGRSCADSVPEGVSIFRKPVEFVLKSIEDQIQILLTGITSEPTIISGMPTRLNTIVEAQGLEMPFGCIDHRSVVKRLPTIPSKRKVALI